MEQTILERDARPETEPFDELLDEIAMTYPLAGNAAYVEDDPERSFDTQILGGLVAP